jgi:hypothetical protein
MRGVAKWLHSFISFIPRTDWLFVVTYSRLLCHAPCHVCCDQTKRNASYASHLVTSTGYPRVVERFSLSILTSGRTRPQPALQHTHTEGLWHAPCTARPLSLLKRGCCTPPRTHRVHNPPATPTMSPIISTFVLAFTLASSVHAFFRINCANIQRGRIDPLVNPGALAAHSHSIVGGSSRYTTIAK